MKTLLASLVVLMGLNGVAAAQYPPPPALYHEMVPVRPGPRYVWQPGHWQWNDYHYVWVRGRYLMVEPRHVHRQWVHGHWEYGRWVHGHWR